MRAPQLRDLHHEVEKADELLIHYGFHRETLRNGGLMSYTHAVGALIVSVAIDVDDDLARLALSVRGHQSRPWSFGVPPKPFPVALEAAWFVAVTHGLTPPVVGGILVTEWERRMTPEPTRTEPDASH